MRAFRRGFTRLARPGASLWGHPHRNIGHVDVDSQHGHADHILDRSRNLRLDLHAEIVEIRILVSHDANIHTNRPVNDLDTNPTTANSTAKTS